MRPWQLVQLHPSRLYSRADPTDILLLVVEVLYRERRLIEPAQKKKKN